MSGPEQQRLQHTEYQRRYFDSNCDFFRQPIPKEIEERTSNIVRNAKLRPQSRVLDVGTGMGVLIRHFLEEGVDPANVVGCDLSANMLAEAKQKYPQAQFWQGDIADFPTQKYGKFEAVFFNACFGNIYDQDKAVAVASAVLERGGRIIISHPLGNEFVEKLKQQDQQLILTLLPDRNVLERFCRAANLEIEKFEDVPDFYLAVLHKL
jgi:ubiquinone/menaquinone biosynthesis C-methylase UbiE